MIARYEDGTTIIDVLVGREDLDRVNRQLPCSSVARLSGTGERVYLAYLEYPSTLLAEPSAEFDGHSINILLPRHFRSAHLIERDENYLSVYTRLGKKEGRVIRLNVQPRRSVPL